MVVPHSAGLDLPADPGHPRHRGHRLLPAAVREALRGLPRAVPEPAGALVRRICWSARRSPVRRGVARADHHRTAQHLPAVRAVRLLVPADALRAVVDRRSARSAIHIGVKLPVIARYWRKRDAYDADRVAASRSDDPDAALEVPDELQRLTGWRQSTRASPGGCSRGWIAPRPRRPRAGRRETPARIPDAPWPSRRRSSSRRRRASPSACSTPSTSSRRASSGVGPQGLPVNRTAKAAGVLETRRRARVDAHGRERQPREKSFTRSRLRRTPAARRRPAHRVRRGVEPGCARGAARG